MLGAAFGAEGVCVNGGVGGVGDFGPEGGEVSV